MTAIAPHTRAQAKALRRMMTPQERRLWQHLRDLNRQLGLHFRRQAPVGPFIADFCDFGRRQVIELDGSGHGGHSDARRDGWFQAQGFDVLRFWNADVDGNIDGVMQVILDAVETGARAQDGPAPSSSGQRPDPASPHAGPRAPPPPCGEGMGVGGSPPIDGDHP